MSCIDKRMWRAGKSAWCGYGLPLYRLKFQASSFQREIFGWANGASSIHFQVERKYRLVKASQDKGWQTIEDQRLRRPDNPDWEKILIEQPATAVRIGSEKSHGVWALEAFLSAKSRSGAYAGLGGLGIITHGGDLDSGLKRPFKTGCQTWRGGGLQQSQEAITIPPMGWHRLT